MKLIAFFGLAFAMFVATVLATGLTGAPAATDTLFEDTLNRLLADGDPGSIPNRCTACKMALITCINGEPENLKKCYTAFCHDQGCRLCGLMDCRPWGPF